MKNGDMIICLDNIPSTYIEQSTSLTVGNKYRLVSKWSNLGIEYIGLFDDKRIFKNFVSSKFCLESDNFYNKRFKILTSKKCNV